MTGHASTNDIDVLREMVRIAEKRRDEEMKMIERINQHNLALIAFAGSFLSLLITTKLSVVIVCFAGCLLLISVFLSLWAVLPQTLKGVLTIKDDVRILRRGEEKIHIHTYLLDVAELTEHTADAAAELTRKKKWKTIWAGIFLALSLLATYTLYIIYA